MRVPRRQPLQRAHQAYPFQAPLKGIDVSQPLPGGDPLTAVRLENLVPRVYGCQLRGGYHRWCSNMGGEIRTLMSYQPAANTGDKLFAASSDNKVYDVTVPLASGDVPPTAFTPNIGVRDGEFSWINFTTSADVHYLVCVGEGSGYWIFDGTTWTNVVQGTGALQVDGVDPAKFDYVMIWKSRLWFIEANTTNAWYLPVGQVAGTAKKFNFGPLLANGGALAVMANWTVDGGDGMDDNLVIVSTQGDVLIYKGTDPDDASKFSMIGRWFLGRVPTGRRCVTQYSQDLAILSERGMAFLSELLRGQGFFANAALATNVNAELAALISTSLDRHYWEVRYLPHEQLLVINMPARSSGEFQFAYEVNNKAFCTLTNLPMLTVQSHNGRSYFGDSLGNVWLAFDGNSDGAVDDVPGRDLEGSVVTAFSPLGEGFTVKRFLMVRPSFTSRSAPAISVQLNPNWFFNLPAGAPPYLAAGDSLWDSGRWDNAVWSGTSNSYEAWIGVTGTGRYGALAMKVRGEAGTTFIGWTALVEAGGIL